MKDAAKWEPIRFRMYNTDKTVFAYIKCIDR